MTVEYLDSKRVQGSSTSTPNNTATKEFDFSSNTNWDVSNGGTGDNHVEIDTTNGYVLAYKVMNYSNDPKRVAYDLQTNDSFTLSDSKWYCDFEVYWLSTGGDDNLGTGQGIGFSAGNNQMSDISTDCIVLDMGGTDTQANIALQTQNGETEYPTSSINIPFNTTMYCRMERLSTTEVRWSIFTDSARTTHATGSPQTKTDAGIANVTGLSWCVLANRAIGSGGRESTYRIDNVKIYNNMDAIQDDKATLLTDSLGSAVDGTNVGTTTTSNTPIYDQTAISMNGSSQYAKDFGTSSSFASLTEEDFTIAFWLKAGNQSSGNFAWIIGNGNVSGDQNGLIIGADWVTGGTFYINMRGGDDDKTAFNDLETSAIFSEDDKWHHYVFEFDNTNELLSIFKDGANTATYTQSYNEEITGNKSTTYQAMAIGRMGGTANRYYDGDIADVGIWKRLLTTGASSEVSDLYNTMTSSLTTATSNATGAGIETLSNKAGLLAHWKCNDANWTNSAVGSLLPSNTIFNETDTYKQYWLQDGKWNESGALPATYMVTMGGSNTSDMQRITVATSGSAEDFGDLSPARPYGAGCANETRALCAGGEPSSATEDINYITIATKSNSSDFGDLMASEQRQSGLQSIPVDRGVFTGGLSDATNMQYVTVSTTGDATDFGNMNQSRYFSCTAWSETRGVICSGSSTATIDYITIATASDASDFGDLYTAKYQMGGITDLTKAILCAGYNISGTANVKRCDHITIATTGDATEWGDCISAGSGLQGAFSGGDLKNKGILAGGYNNVEVCNVMQITTIATGSSFADYGDLVVTNQTGASANGS